MVTVWTALRPPQYGPNIPFDFSFVASTMWHSMLHEYWLNKLAIHIKIFCFFDQSSQVAFRWHLLNNRMF